MALKAAEETTIARWRRSGRRLEFWHQLHELMRQNRVARNAGSGERCERRRRARIRAERFCRCELGRKRRTAIDRAPERLGGDRRARGPIAAA